MCGGGKGQERREGKEEEEENGAFAFVNGKPETQKGRKEPRTVVMDGRRAAGRFFFRGFSIRGRFRSLYYDFGA
jgi:hypothetical protein